MIRLFILLLISVSNKIHSQNFKTYLKWFNNINIEDSAKNIQQKLIKDSALLLTSKAIYEKDYTVYTYTGKFILPPNWLNMYVDSGKASLNGGLVTIFGGHTYTDDFKLFTLVYYFKKEIMPDSLFNLAIENLSDGVDKRKIKKFETHYYHFVGDAVEIVKEDSKSVLNVIRVAKYYDPKKGVYHLVLSHEMNNY